MSAPLRPEGERPRLDLLGTYEGNWEIRWSWTRLCYVVTGQHLLMTAKTELGVRTLAEELEIDLTKWT